MKTLLNFATLKKGGGQNVGLNMIKCLILEKYDLTKFAFVVATGSSIETELKNSGVKDIILAPQNPIKRIIFELINGEKIITQYKIDVIYTLFGIGLYPKRCVQISGSADSNIFFPEINFWEEYKGFKRLRKLLVDRYRIYALKRASAVIFENQAIHKRAKKLFQLSNTLFSKPSINPYFPDQPLNFPLISSDTKIGLFLCGWQKNKNYNLIPSLLKEFKSHGLKFHIIITAPKSEKEHFDDFMLKSRNLGVEKMLTVIGSVNKNQLKNLFAKIDYVFLLSKLESFSNNIIESWFFKKVLVISNRKWSKGICKDGAIYVDRDSPKNIVQNICDLENDVNKKNSIIANGSKILKTYPTMKEKIDLELTYIKSLYEGS